MSNFSYQAAAIRHFLPIVEKDKDGSIAQQYLAALHTLEYLAQKQNLLRELRVLDINRPELNQLSEGIV